MPPAELPFSEACRLLVNRGMGLLFAGEKISGNSEETDFIMRNIYKAILGAADAMLIARKNYRWKISERLEVIENSDMPDEWKALYREAVDFKHSPHRQKKPDMVLFWNQVRDFFRAAVIRCAGSDCDLHKGIYQNCCQCGELSLKNFIKYCIKSHSLPQGAWKYYSMPTVAVLVSDVFSALNEMPEKINEQSKLYRHWLIFN